LGLIHRTARKPSNKKKTKICPSRRMGYKAPCSSCFLFSRLFCRGNAAVVSAALMDKTSSAEIEPPASEPIEKWCGTAVILRGH
jgi:hypothetical protein